MYYQIYSNNKKLGSGLYGKYFQVSSKSGIKLLGRGFKTIDNIFKNPKSLILAEKEVELLNIAKKTKLSPRYAKVVFAKYKNKFYPAILMEHFSGKTMEGFDENLNIKKCFIDKKTKKLKYSPDKNTENAYNYLISTLEKKKIKHKDLHENNVIVTKSKKLKVIDFSPDWIRVLK